LNYLEETWDREPDLDRAAGLANCSSFHFMRMFEVVCGMGPSEYSRRRRLSRAAVDLAAGDEKVIEVALRYGYESPEAFAKAFKRLFGLTPSEARVPGVALETWPPLRLAVVLQGGPSGRGAREAGTTGKSRPSGTLAWRRDGSRPSIPGWEPGDTWGSVANGPRIERSSLT